MVAGFLNPLVQSPAKPFQEPAVARVAGQVAELAGVAGEVVELLLWSAFGHPFPLGVVEAVVRVPLAQHGQGRMHGDHVGFVHVVGQLGAEVADVLVALCTQAADAVGGVVDAVARGEDILAPRRLLAQEDDALHVRGHINSGQAQAQRLSRGS